LSPKGRDDFVDKFDVGSFFKYGVDEICYEIEFKGEDEAKYAFHIA